jgi:D-xylose transport system ATP-binding protein
MSLIEFKDISIQFPGVKALWEVSFAIEKGEIMALCGENGAGKSTLAKILAGVYPHGQYHGEIKYKGKILKNRLPIQAEHEGIFIVHQELTLFKEMTVAENIFLSHFPTKFGMIDYDKIRKLAQKYLEDLDLDIDPDTQVKYLTVAVQQMVEIVKALSGKAELIIFDESTSALTNNEILDLFKIIKQLKQKGVTIIFVTHKLEEIFEICDTVTVLKDGHLVRSGVSIDGVSKDDVIKMMIGREIKEMFPPKSKQAPGKVLFAVKDWNFWNSENGKKIVDKFSFEVREKEILGMCGLVGAGRTELVNSLFEGGGSGEMYLDGKPISVKSTHDSVKHGISLITEDRKNLGLLQKQSVSDNLSSASLDSIKGWLGVIDERKENIRNEEMTRRMAVKLHSMTQIIDSLSGGNQQKVIIGKWLHTIPKLLILDEPTKGIDVGSKAEMYKMIRELADAGIGILIVSSELLEIIGVCDRVIVVCQGRNAGEFTGDLKEETLLNTAMGR